MNNIRNFAMVAAMVSAVAVSNAQSFQLRAGAGATMNGNTFVVAPGSSFTVEVWYVNPHAGPRVNVGNVALAFDRTNGSGATATGLDNKLSVTSNQVFGSVVNADAPGVLNFERSLGTNFSIRSAAVASAAGNNYGFAGGAARPLTAFQSIQTPIGTAGAFNGDTKVMEFVINASAIANGDTYGDDANEAGLFAVHQGTSTTGAGPQTGASGWFGTNSNFRAGSEKYAVQAVPEPATMVAVAAGLAAFARRRRSK